MKLSTLRWPKVFTVFAVALAPMTAASAATAATAQQREDELPAGWVDLAADRVPLGQVGETALSRGGDDNVWAGYDFPLRAGVHVGCDDWRGRQVSFGSDDVRFYFDAQDPGIEFRGDPCDDRFGLFLRFEGDVRDGVREVRMMTFRRAARRLDDPVVWFGRYPADDSVRYLRPAVLGTGGGLSTASAKARERLLSAVAVHGGDASIDVVTAALDGDQPQDLREGAVFWTSQIGGDEGVERLLGLARDDADRDIRKSAIFWLGQLAGERATEDLADIAGSDPDTEVRKSAVFALSQSEDDAAIHALIRIVRGHRNPEVIKAALFWLGQSGDGRAIALFQEILFGRRN